MSEKNGGPYTKAEQEKRRTQVFEMHFKKGQSALKIAETLDVNRNTINDDIKYWYDELAADLKSYSIEGWAAKQYNRLEEQRARLEELLQRQESISHVITIEKMLLELDRTILKFITPIIARQRHEVSDLEAIQTTEYLLLNDSTGESTTYSKENLLCGIIEYKGCDIIHAQKIFEKLESLGLGLFENQELLLNTRIYNLLEFAQLRKILSPEKLEEISQKAKQARQNAKIDFEALQKREKQIEAKYVEQYGPESGWSRDVWREFVKETQYDLENSSG